MRRRDTRATLHRSAILAASAALAASASLTGCALIPGLLSGSDGSGSGSGSGSSGEVPSKATPKGPESAWLRAEYTAGEVTPWEIPGGLCGFSADGAITVTLGEDPATGGEAVIALRTGSDEVAWSRPGASCGDASTSSDHTLVRQSSDESGSDASLVLLDTMNGAAISETPAPGARGFVDLFAVDDQGFQAIVSRGESASVVSASADGAVRWETELPSGIWDYGSAASFIIEYPAICTLIGDHTVCTNQSAHEITAFDSKTGEVTLPATAGRGTIIATQDGWVDVTAIVVSEDTPAQNALLSYEGKQTGEVPNVANRAGLEFAPVPGRKAGVSLQAMDLATGVTMVAHDGTIVARALVSGEMAVGQAQLEPSWSPVGVSADGGVAVVYDQLTATVAFFDPDGNRLGEYASAEMLELDNVDGTLVESGLQGKPVALLPSSRP